MKVTEHLLGSHLKGGKRYRLTPEQGDNLQTYYTENGYTRAPVLKGDDLKAAIAAQREIDIARIKEAAPAPKSILAWQAKAILSIEGLLDDAELVIDNLQEPQKTIVRSAWDNNADFPRNSETIVALATALGLTDSDLEEMFKAGSKLKI